MLMCAMKKILTTLSLSIAASLFGGYLYTLHADAPAELNWGVSLVPGIVIGCLVLLRDRSIFSILKR